MRTDWQGGSLQLQRGCLQERCLECRHTALRCVSQTVEAREVMARGSRNDEV